MFPSHANTSSEYVIAIVEYRSEHEVNFQCFFPVKCKKSTSTLMLMYDVIKDDLFS